MYSSLIYIYVCVYMNAHTYTHTHTLKKYNFYQKQDPFFNKIDWKVQDFLILSLHQEDIPILTKNNHCKIVQFDQYITLLVLLVNIECINEALLSQK